MIDIDELVQPERGRVNMRVYVDEEIFRAELRRIFYTTWVYVAHESELPQPGDYKTTYIGLVPVIVSRDAGGAVHVLVNRCSHRGATVCQHEIGNAQSFRCEYHAWTYALDGALIGISRRSGYAPAEIAEFNAGLQAVARVASYRGLIFASFAADGPSLEEHLGGARPYLDEWSDLSPTGSVVLEGGTWKHTYNGNWKLQVEGSNEGYHPEFLHRMSSAMRNQAGTGAANFPWADSDARGFDLGNGHSIMEFPDNRVPQAPDYVALLERAHGQERAARALNGSWRMALFPNLAISQANLRVIRPLAVDRTEVWQQHVALPGVPPVVNIGRVRGDEFFYGPSGAGAPDDLEMFERIQEGARSVSNAELDPWIWFNRGLGSETRGPNGERVAHTTSEVEQRAVYRAWYALMNAGATTSSVAARR